MSDHLTHTERWRTHRQPRTPLTHWSKGGDLHAGTDPTRCDECNPPAHPLTPADPHPHAWADLGTPGLHGSVCRLCGETQID